MASSIAAKQSFKSQGYQHTAPKISRPESGRGIQYDDHTDAQTDNQQSGQENGNKVPGNRQRVRPVNGQNAI